MLYLAPPFHIIEGLSVFGDHADPRQFYYLPLMPHLTVTKDEITGADIPQISLIKYRGEAGKGGFLNFDVNLGVDQDKLKKVARKLRNEMDLDDDPRLAPVPLIDGSIKLMLLGRESGDDFSDDQTAKFVVDIDHSAKPALYGSNQASFSVALDEAGVTVLEKTLAGEMLPIGVVYSLDYLALRPAYSVSVKADWSRVQHHLQESFGANFIFFSTQIDKIVDELIEDKVIEIEIDSFIPPGEDASAIMGRLDQAVNEVKDMVLENFFEPSLEPIREEEDGWDKFAKTAERVALLHAAGGWSGIGGFKIKNVDITRIDKKRLDVNMTERTTVKRSIYPQAHLKGLLRLLRDHNGEIDSSRFVKEVDLDDPWFQERRVNVISRANFFNDGVDSVNVKLTYNRKPQNVILDAQTSQATLNWKSKFVNGKQQQDVKVQYEVSFKDIDSSEQPIRLKSKEEIIDVENFEVRPHELYASVPVAIVALNFPWEQYPQVEVHVRYEDQDNSIRMDEVFMLDEENPEHIWKLFTLNPEKNNFEYKLIYRSSDHKDLETSWTQNDTEQITIRDPYPKKRKLQIVPAFNWREVSTVFVDVTYEDQENGIRETYSVDFGPNDRRFKTVEIKQFVNPAHRFISYKTSIIFNDGRFIETPPSVTLEERIIITSRILGHRIISVNPEAVPFEQRGIQEIEVFLKYEDENAGLTFMDSFPFRSHEDHPRFFEFDYGNTQKKSFEYQVIYTHTNGLQRFSEWETYSNDLLIISTN